MKIPNVEDPEQIPKYAKFMKDLMTKKRTVSFYPNDNVYHCSTIASRSLAEKKEDLGAFKILCTIGSSNLAQALCDLCSSINLMPLVVYKKLDLGSPTLTSMNF